MSDWLDELQSLKSSWEHREVNSYQPYRKAVLDNADELVECARRVEELERAMKEVLLDLSGRQLPVPRETKELCEKALGYRYDIKSDTWVQVENT